MPLPTPTGDESEDDFIGRCVPVLMDEGKEQDQALAICFKQWRGDETKQTAVQAHFARVRTYLSKITPGA